MGEGSTSSYQHFDVFTNPEISQILLFRVFIQSFITEASLMKSLASQDRIQSPASYTSSEVRGRTESSNPLITFT